MIIAINAISAKSGGMKTYTGNLVKSLRKYKKHTFHIWVPYYNDFKENENIILHRTKAVDYNFFIRFIYEQLFLKRGIQKIKADIVFSSATFGILSKNLKQVLLIRESCRFNKLFLLKIWPKFSIYTKTLKILRKHVTILSSNYSKIIIFPSFAMKDDFVFFNPKVRNKCRVNYYGTLIDKFKNYKKVKNESSQINLLYVSVYYAHKNPGVIADAIKLIKRKNIKISARITMDLDSDHAKSFVTWNKDYCKLFDPELKGDIHLGPEPHERISQLYKNADLFIFPSFVESFGHPMIEAMAAGLPIIAADTPINREICGEAAIYFSPFDGKELAEKIVTLYNNEEQKHRMIEIGKNRIKLFKWEDHVNRLIEIFEKLNE